MMKVSREYQTAIENDIPRYLKDYGSVIVQAPTGSGKSHVINKTVSRVVRAGLIPLVLSDSIKIHGQLVTECAGIRLDSGIRSMEIMWGHVYVAMTQTLRNRPNIISQLHYVREKLVIIVDECHRNTMTPLVQAIQPAYLIGFSATPHFKWAKHLPKLYKSLIHGPQINTLVEDGFLCHYRHIIRTGADLDQLRLKGQDFSEESQEAVFSSKKMYDGIFDDLPKFPGQKTCIYVASIKMCEDMYERCVEHGYRATRYHSELPNAHYELSKFTHLHTADVCVSVGALTLGWDYPPIDRVVLWRSTTSLPLYLQICGRGGRPCSTQDALNKWNLPNYRKEQFLVLDYGGNYERFGGWNMDRDWSELWQDPRKKRKISTYNGVAASKECPVCHALLMASARSCYNCGYIYPEADLKLIDGHLVEVQDTLARIRGRFVSDLNPRELADFAKYHDRKQYAIRVARRQEQEQPGFLRLFADCMEYRNGWVDQQLERIPKDGTKIDFYNTIIK